MQDKLYYEERKKSDFLKPSKSENVMFRSQVANIDETVRILEKDNEWLMNAGKMVDGGQELPQNDQQNFNKEQYLKLKQEIKERKAAKQRILAQGFPELKSYSRL